MELLRVLKLVCFDLFFSKKGDLFNLFHVNQPLRRLLLIPTRERLGRDRFCSVDVWTCLPFAPLRCCGGSSPSAHPGDSLWRRRTPWTPAPRIRHPRCSRPTSSPPQADLCGGSRNRTWWTCPRRRSASPRTPRLLKLWRGRRPTPGWL